ARYDDAERVLRRALDVRDVAAHAKSPDLARTLELISLVHLRAGHYAQARAPLERALSIRQAYPAHADTGVAFGLLGDLLWFEGRTTAARDAYQQCTAIGQQVLRDTHPNIAHCTRRLGLALSRLGDLSASLASFERAVSLAERSLGSTHPGFA